MLPLAFAVALPCGNWRTNKRVGTDNCVDCLIARRSVLHCDRHLPQALPIAMGGTEGAGAISSCTASITALEPMK